MTQPELLLHLLHILSAPSVRRTLPRYISHYSKNHFFFRCLLFILARWMLQSEIQSSPLVNYDFFPCTHAGSVMTSHLPGTSYYSKAAGNHKVTCFTITVGMFVNLGWCAHLLIVKWVMILVVHLSCLLQECSWTVGTHARALHLDNISQKINRTFVLTSKTS